MEAGTAWTTAAVMAGAALMAPGLPARGPAAPATGRDVTVACSATALAAAIRAAGDGTTLRLPGKCTYDLVSALPTISTRLTIRGKGSIIQRSSAPAAPDFTMVTVTPDGGLTVEGLSFRDGSARDAAAAIRNSGTLNVAGGTFSGNTTTGYGAAIGNYGTLTVTGAAFSGNRSADGGAIVNLGTATISSSSFDGNRASVNGGALHNEGHVTISGDAFSGNTAARDGGGMFNGVDGTQDSVSGSTFSKNQASNGGGIYNEDVLSLASVLIASSRVTANGGGIYTDWSLTAAQSSITANTAGGDGGGIYNGSDLGSPGSVALNGTTVTGNQPDACAPASLPCSGAQPGGPSHAGTLPRGARPAATAAALARDFRR